MEDDKMEINNCRCGYCTIYYRSLPRTPLEGASHTAYSATRWHGENRDRWYSYRWPLFSCISRFRRLFVLCPNALCNARHRLPTRASIDDARNLTVAFLLIASPSVADSVDARNPWEAGLCHWPPPRDGVLDVRNPWVVLLVNGSPA
jgi:hypothetical protein